MNLHMHEVEAELLDILREVKWIVDHGVDDIGIMGICHIAEAQAKYREAHQVVMRQLFRMWPEFDGSVIFPIGSPDPQEYASKAYQNARDRHAMWSGEYGAARHRLLAWMIDALERRVAFAEALVDE